MLAGSSKALPGVPWPGQVEARREQAVGRDRPTSERDLAHRSVALMVTGSVGVGTRGANAGRR